MTFARRGVTLTEGKCDAVAVLVDEKANEEADDDANDGEKEKGGEKEEVGGGKTVLSMFER